MQNLVIIGNGFDLAHNIKSRYKDFIRYVTNSIIKYGNETFPQLFEYKEIQINNYQFIIDEYKRDPKTLELYLKFNNKFFELIFTDFVDNNWSDIESLYYNHLNYLFDSNTELTPFESIFELNRDFEVIKNCLKTYLLIPKINAADSIDSFNDFFKKIDLDNESMILNFNYTNTLGLYESLTKHTKIINIHGSIEDENNPIIFGYAADSKSARKLINKDNEYTINIKKYNYKLTDNLIKLTDFIDNNVYNVIIMGHSCGDSDKKILNDIFNNNNLYNIKINYYNTINHYIQLQRNIDRIMNNDNFEHKISEYPKCHRLPQFNDTASLKSSYPNFLKTI